MLPISKRVWTFVESPITWGGIGVLAGATLTSPSWFRYVFLAAGIAIGVGWWRARVFLERVWNLLCCLVIAAAWLGLWKFIPKPETTDEIATAVAAKIAPVIHNGGSEPRQSQSDTSSEIADAIIRRLPAKAPQQEPDFSIPFLRDALDGEATRLRELFNTWNVQDISLYEQTKIAPSEGLGQILKQRADLRSNFNLKAVSILADSAKLRKQAFRILGTETQVEKVEDQDISSAIKLNFGNRSTRDAVKFASYLTALASRFPS